MDTSSEEVKKFKRQLNEINTQDNQLFIQLFLVLIEHLEKEVNNGTHYFSLLLHNPLDDIPEEDDKNLYKKLISNNSSEIIDLTSIIPSLQTNNSKEISKIINMVFENAIFTSSDESPLDYEFSEWFNDMSQNVYRKIKRIQVLYNESNSSASNTDYCNVFKLELKTNSPVSRKRKHSKSSEEVEDNKKFNKRIKKVITSEYFENKICEIMNCMNWGNFLKEKMKNLDEHVRGIAIDVNSKNPNLTDEQIKELIKAEFNKSSRI